MGSPLNVAGFALGRGAVDLGMGKKGGKKGGTAMASNMTPEERTESARNAVLARWKKTKENTPGGR